MFDLRNLETKYLITLPSTESSLECKLEHDPHCIRACIARNWEIKTAACGMLFPAVLFRRTHNQKCG